MNGEGEREAAGFDGTLPNGRTLQVRSRKAEAHGGAGSCIALSEWTCELADDVLIVLMDYDCCVVTRTVGPVVTGEVECVARRGRCDVSDILAIAGVAAERHS